MKDVIIIGGGVIGSLIARELARYQLSIAVVEKHADVACETSKANSSIVHAGFDAQPHTNKARFNIPGNQLMEQVCQELNVPFKRNGSMVLAFNDEQNATLQTILKQGMENQVPDLSILSAKEALALEPNLSDKIHSALLAPSSGIVCPYLLTHHAAQNAAENGVSFFFETKALSITSVQGQGTHQKFVLETSLGSLESRYLINAAGLFADEIAHMAGDPDIHISPRKGEYLLFDKRRGNTIGHTIFQTPTAMGKGVLVTPTVDGNLLVGPTAYDIHDKLDYDTTDEGLNIALSSAAKSIPEISKRDIITSFAGLRAIEKNNDFIIGESKHTSCLIHAAGVQSPGLSAAPAIAIHIGHLINQLTGGLKKNTAFNPYIQKQPEIAKLSPEEIQKAIEQNPLYGNIICRCETVSEGEIVNAIRNACGAKNMDGLKRRTRAGMGRCQGGFCMPKLLEILSRERHTPFTTITKNDQGSYILVGKTKPKENSYAKS